MTAHDKKNYHTKFFYMVAYPIVGILGSTWPIYGSILTAILLFVILILKPVQLPLASIFVSGIFVNIAFLVRDFEIWGFGLSLCFAAVFLIATLFLPIDRKITFFRKV